MRHLCPTAPDTLRIYPFKESDPFIVAPSQSQSNLNLEDEAMEHSADTDLYTQVPNVYFVGNM